MNKKLIFIIMLVCVLAFVAVMAYSQTSPSVRWEYHFTSYDATQNEFNSLGADGWEWVGRNTNRSIFKRRLP